MNPHQKPQEDVVGLIAKLRALMADASDQPWVYRPEKYDDWGWIRGTERDSDIGRYRPIVACAKNSDIGFDQMQPYRDTNTDPYGPNAMLIVEAVNSLPVLLNAVEQAYEAGRRDMREAADEPLDYIDLFRIIRRAGRKDAAKAKAVHDAYTAAMRFAATEPLGGEG